ncbi:hypothetical protein EDC04DRAFT_2614225 [Pisolithus marmoratus]|nr:hypothetical protein EDC04DRAFT_2614225 [Pisolithus marmoratus]
MSHWTTVDAMQMKTGSFSVHWVARASKANPPPLEVKNCGESQWTWLVSWSSSLLLITDANVRQIMGIMTITIQKQLDFIWKLHSNNVKIISALQYCKNVF